jgi:hypothetical protein
MSRNFTFFPLILLLGSCSTMPSNPSVMVLPGTDSGINFGQFSKDDAQCRDIAHNRLETAKEEPDSWEESQQFYDIHYLQCMYERGHRVPVPSGITYGTRQEWQAPPPPNMPPPNMAPSQ